MFRAQPKTELSKFINAYKSARRLLKKEYPEIREKLWKEAFWSQSFCLLTTGRAPVEVIRQNRQIIQTLLYWLQSIFQSLSKILMD